MHAVILAGGKGTRLAPYTTTIPKPLVPIGQYPILEIILRQLRYYGITTVTLSLGHMAAYIKSFFGDGKKFGLKINYCVEDKPLGTAGSLSLIKRPREPFFMLNGDLFTALNFKKMLQFHYKKKNEATIGLYKRSEKIDLGIIELDKHDTITGYIEKPTYDWYISMGIYVLNPSVIRLVPKNKHYDLPDLVRDLLSQKRKVSGYKNPAYWLDIGRPDDYQKAIEIFSAKKKLFLKDIRLSK